MNILVTGAAGFLGSHLANRLVHEGHSVRALDDLSTSEPNHLSPEIQFIRGDINDRPKLWTLLQKVDLVFHLAARVVVPESVIYPGKYSHANVCGTVTLLEALRDVGSVHRLVFISSGAIYGDQAAQPINENALPKPQSPYAASKLAAEFLINTIGARESFETVILRVFNAYGPNQHIPPSNPPVIPAFLRQAVFNGTIVVNGDGSQSRDYVYVEDVVDAAVTAGTAPGINQVIINVGSGVETSVRDLVARVIEVTGGSPQVIYNPHNEGGASHLCADITLAGKLLDYQPKTSLSTGLRLTLEQDPRLKK